ncbi:hypothetical protein FN846DRAFT_887701 [Sphaerosporella brunnea]|uniref:Uncharacterized protein n=1 Tax=Sphaerosporella brunnea TaxID=1250544 RepID=A0A5J5F5J6_9PEZI|nr:hypothetical protein FN846DRAFT_887701 [Sphaerosporella brunnea]
MEEARKSRIEGPPTDNVFERQSLKTKPEKPEAIMSKKRRHTQTTPEEPIETKTIPLIASLAKLADSRQGCLPPQPARLQTPNRHPDAVEAYIRPGRFRSVNQGNHSGRTARVLPEPMNVIVRKEEDERSTRSSPVAQSSLGTNLQPSTKQGGAMNRQNVREGLQMLGGKRTEGTRVHRITKRTARPPTKAEVPRTFIPYQRTRSIHPTLSPKFIEAVLQAKERRERVPKVILGLDGKVPEAVSAWMELVEAHRKVHGEMKVDVWDFIELWESLPGYLGPQPV